MSGPTGALSATRLGVVVVSHQQQYLRECLESINDQSVTPSATVLVDNASPREETAAAIAEAMGVHTIRLSDPTSLGTARNLGCELLANCDYIVTLDGDDVLRPRYVEVVWRAADERSADVVYTAAELFGSASGVIFSPPLGGERRDLRRGNFIPAMALFKHSLWRAAGGFDPNLAFFEDWDFWLSCAERGATFHGLDEVLWRYRRHESSMLATAQEEQKAVSRRYIRAKHLKYIWGPFQWRRAWRNVEKLRGQP